MTAPVRFTDEVWLICGGRDFSRITLFTQSMRDVVDQRGCPICIIHGGYKGADTMADNWAREWEVDCIRVAARWLQHGKKAGPLRNTRMIEAYGNIDLVIAFPGGKGTADMIRKAKAANIPVIDYDLNQGD